MSISPRVVTPSERVNEYTVVIEEGAADGICEGDRLMLETDDGRYLQASVVDASEEKSVVEIQTV